jgi:hypothetical protein
MPGPSDRYKWIALSNVTLGVLLATLDGSIVLIAMPSIFRGIHLDPLVPAQTGTRWRREASGGVVTAESAQSMEPAGTTHSQVCPVTAAI